MREPVDGPVLAVVPGRLRSTRRSRWPTTATTASARRCGPPTATGASRIARELQAGMVWLNDHLPGPTVSRGPWGAAAGGGLGRTLGRAGAARLRAGEADHLGPPARCAGCGGGPTTRASSAPRGRWPGSAPRATPTASAPGARAAADRSRGSARGPSGAGCRADWARAGARRARLRLPLRHARPGLRRQGVRLPAAQGDLRPELRAGHARHPLLHRLPEADGPALRGRRRRRDRAGEGRGAARLRRRGDADRARGRAGAAGVRARGLDPLGAARLRRPGGPRGRVHGDRRDRRHRRQHRRLRRRRARARCSSTSSTCRRCATSSCPRSCAPARWRSRSPPPAPRRRWPSA